MTTILVVEDDEKQAAQLTRKLQDDLYEVVTIKNGLQALEIARSQMPDLIILDIKLPGMDGLSISRILKRDSDTSHIPIIILTSRGMEEDKIIGLESGADDYVVKPVAFGEMLSRVRALLRRKKQHVVHELTSGNLRLNLQSHRVFLGEDELLLSNKEFAVLAELLRCPGTVLSRGFLLTKVWGTDTFIEGRTIDVHIRWLRQKIEANPNEPQRIKTIRGVGYRFEG